MGVPRLGLTWSAGATGAMAKDDNLKQVFSKFSQFPFYGYNPDLEEVWDFFVT